jgi:hypothetical protein
VTADTAWVVEHACSRKQRYPRAEAMRLAETKRAQGIEVSAYRCPFADQGRHWHLGHAPGMETLEDIAHAIRDLHGNAPAELVEVDA